MKTLTRIGAWSVYVYDDDEFEHARHDDPNVLIAWSYDAFVAADAIAAAEFRRRYHP